MGSRKRRVKFGQSQSAHYSVEQPPASHLTPRVSRLTPHVGITPSASRPPPPLPPPGRKLPKGRDGGDAAWSTVPLNPSRRPSWSLPSLSQSQAWSRSRARSSLMEVDEDAPVLERLGESARAHVCQRASSPAFDSLFFCCPSAARQVAYFPTYRSWLAVGLAWARQQSRLLLASLLPLASCFSRPPPNAVCLGVQAMLCVCAHARACVCACVRVRVRLRVQHCVSIHTHTHTQPGA